MNTELQKLDLSEKDFMLIIDGLDALPKKDLAGEMMGDLLGALIMKDDSEGKRKMEIDREQRQLKAKREKETMIEDIKILQGKLLMLKRFLQQQGALRETYDIINHVK